MKAWDYKSWLVFLGLTFTYIFLTTYSLFDNGSYWMDELFSVEASKSSLKEMFTIWLIPDVHPPLYQLVLKLWVFMFGVEEWVTRALSIIFGLIAVITFLCWLKIRFDKRSMFLGGAILVTHSLLTYYSQEARSYAMMFLGATTSTIFLFDYLSGYTKIITKQFLLYFSLIILSLSHYFGLIYSGLIIILLLFYHRKVLNQFLLTIFVGMAMLIWPLFHFLSGRINELSGGNFWITSDGFSSTIQKFTSALFPVAAKWWKTFIATDDDGLLTIFYSVILLMILVPGFITLNYSKRHNDPRKQTWNYMGMLFVSFLFLVIMIDYHTPISTQRNFIVILPLLVMLIIKFSMFYITKSSSIFYFSIVSLLYFSSSILSLYSLKLKNSFPRENIKQVVAEAFSEKYKDKSKYFVKSNDCIKNYNRSMHYINKLAAASHINWTEVNHLEACELEGSFVIIALFSARNKFEELKVCHQNRMFFYPEQMYGNPFFLIVK